MLFHTYQVNHSFKTILFESQPTVKMDKIIQERITTFWNDPRYQDISFSFEDSDQLLGANKMILGLVSPVFEAMFYGDFLHEDPVAIKDIGYDTFKSFLYFIYTKTFEASSLEEAEDLYYIANKYEVVTMEAACEKFLIKTLLDHNLEEILNFSRIFNLKDLLWLAQLLFNHSPDTTKPATWVTYVKDEPEDVHERMIIAGYDEDGYPIGIGRFKVESDVVPGSYRVKKGCVEVSCGGKSHTNYEFFDVLCDGDVDWVASEGGKLPEHLIQGGQASSYYYEKLYVGQVVHNGNLVIGKVQLNHKCLYIPWEGTEVKIEDNYLCLVDKNKSKETVKGRFMGFLSRTLRKP